MPEAGILGLIVKLLVKAFSFIRLNPTTKAARYLALVIGHRDTKEKFLHVTTEAVEEVAATFQDEDWVVDTLTSDLVYRFWFQFSQGQPYDAAFQREIVAFCQRPLGPDAAQESLAQRSEFAITLMKAFESNLLNKFPEGACWMQGNDCLALMERVGTSILERLQFSPPYKIPAPVSEGDLNWLLYRNPLTELIGRDAEMEDLVSFRDDPQPFLWWSFYGSGGTGKSRLGLEWLRECEKAGWLPVFLDSHSAWSGHLQWIPTHPTAIVVDYASSFEDLERWIDHLIGHAKDGAEVRVLFLDRGVHRPWWIELLTKTGHKTDAIRKGQAGHQFRKPQRLQNVQEPERLFDAAVENLEGPPCDQAEDRAALQNFLTNSKEPLFILGAAGIWAKGVDRNQAFSLNDEEILDRCLKREVERWCDLIPNPHDIAWIKKAVAFVTLCRGCTLAHLKRWSLIHSGSETDANRLEQLGRILLSVKHKDGEVFIYPLEPDRMGERYLVVGEPDRMNGSPLVEPEFDVRDWLGLATEVRIKGLGETLFQVSEATAKNWLAIIWCDCLPPSGEDEQDWWLEAKGLLRLYYRYPDVPGGEPFIIQYQQKARKIGALALQLGIVNHFPGEGWSADLDTARFWYLEAANADFPDAKLLLGTMLLEGTGGEEDLVQARHLFQQAAEAKIPEAMTNLGGMLREGIGGGQDLKKARYWFRQAALASIPEAMFHLADMLLKGEGGGRDLVTARHWSRQAAQANIPEAMFLLGRMLSEGMAGKQDLGGARYWLLRAASLGDVNAFILLGRLAVHTRDFDEAISLLQQAVRHGACAKDFENDSEWESLRERPEFKALSEGAPQERESSELSSEQTPIISPEDIVFRIGEVLVRETMDVNLERYLRNG
ncbi:Sel1 repeat family protein [Sulfidibacter corallicola]|uniref:Sel1 repeat family protein n=1 Tax=Sulfidibacter corallicola TaxID=2818388 RepID=A0A8A4TF59_SULCO|nr:tetratricopeptide repeat protein [Sulfidibacter corallicola]QTD48586.1 sel1 repeat family protein [Sulfidibacter corallicola]